MKEVCLKPTAKIAVKKNVVKIYGTDESNKVFLKDGTEFEIELFNPTNEVILCKLRLNGKFTNDGGLVLNPGQRVFLERYLDEDKKFTFSTYKVDNNEIVDRAIDNNGLVEVFFYKEIVNSWTVTYNQPFTYTTSDGYSSGFVYTTSSGTTNCGISDSQSICSNDITNTFFSSTQPEVKSVPNTEFTVASYKYERKEKETGRVEKGKKSGQLLASVNKYFNNVSFHNVVIKILPDNEKVYEVEDIKHKKYCPECGSKLKPTDKFCSQCGHKV